MIKNKFVKTNTHYLREKLKESNKCHYCNVTLTKTENVLGYNKFGFPVKIPPNEATIDHVYSKWDIRRNCQGGKKKIVLSCYKCNQNKNIIETCKYRNTTYELLYPSNLEITKLIKP